LKVSKSKLHLVGFVEVKVGNVKWWLIYDALFVQFSVDWLIVEVLSKEDVF
jgi:hypothetical protein